MKFDDNIPIYLQIMDECKRRIVIDEYQKSMKVPPVRELAVEFGVNPNTVQRALSELEREGLFVSERTSGRYICNDEAKINELKQSVVKEKIAQFLDAMKQYGCHEDDVLKLIRERINDGKTD